VHGLVGHFTFLLTAATRQILHDAATAVARGKIAMRISARRILAQLGVHQTYGLEDRGKVNLRQVAKAVKGIGDGDAFGSLFKVLSGNHR
jgi:hypothetical protein